MTFESWYLENNSDPGDVVLEALIRQAWEEAHAIGYDEGHDDGYSIAWEKGYSEGIDDGYQGRIQRGLSMTYFVIKLCYSQTDHETVIVQASSYPVAIEGLKRKGLKPHYFEYRGSTESFVVIEPEPVKPLFSIGDKVRSTDNFTGTIKEVPKNSSNDGTDFYRIAICNPHDREIYRYFYEYELEKL